MSTAHAPTEDDLALAAGLFETLHLFKVVTALAVQSCELGSLERAGFLFRLRSGPCRAGVLAQHAKLSPSAVTELVESLEREGFVRREDDPLDRRAVRVALTPEGRRHLQRFEHAVAVALGERLAVLTPAQRQRIRHAFDDLREAAGTTDFTTSSHAEGTLRGTARGQKEAAHVRHDR